jgi:hypothetical protein
VRSQKKEKMIRILNRSPIRIEIQSAAFAFKKRDLATFFIITD